VGIGEEGVFTYDESSSCATTEFPRVPGDTVVGVLGGDFYADNGLVDIR